LEDRPKRIKVEVLPYDDIDINKALDELKFAELLNRYEVAGQQFIEIPSFSRHQRITGKEADAESRFPSASPKKVGKHRGNNGASPGITGDGRETEGKGDDRFLKFWSAYPKKKAKDQAEKAFTKVSEPVEKLLDAIGLAKNSADWRKEGGKFIPYPATWLNGRRWEDVEQIDLLPTHPVRPIGLYDAPRNGL